MGVQHSWIVILVLRRGIALEGLTVGYNAVEGIVDRAYALSPEGENFQVIDSGLYDKVRNDPRFQAELQRIRTQVYNRVRGATIKSG